MRREYTDIVFFCKCLYGSFDVQASGFVSFFSDCRCFTRNSIDSAFLRYCRCVFKCSFFNRIAPMWNYLPYNVDVLYVILLITLLLYLIYNA